MVDADVLFGIDAAEPGFGNLMEGHQRRQYVRRRVLVLHRPQAAEGVNGHQAVALGPTLAGHVVDKPLPIPRRGTALEGPHDEPDVIPDLQIVIEHLGGIDRGAKPPYDEFKPVLDLAKHPNLTIKLPGFGEFCHLPHPFAHIPPLADMALEAFGPQRIMWGSDYPPVSSREGYNNALRFPMEYFSHLSEEDRSWIFGRTARKVWKFE